MSAFIYLDVNTLRLLSYILFVLTLAHFRPPSTYIYREQPKSKSDSTKNFASAPKQLTQSAPKQCRDAAAATSRHIRSGSDSGTIFSHHLYVSIKCFIFSWYSSLPRLITIKFERVRVIPVYKSSLNVGSSSKCFCRIRNTVSLSHPLKLWIVEILIFPVFIQK